MTLIPSILNVNATLNESAQADTGRAGFENDVRLEYSNDPDSNGTGKTGLTPWDTVVAFTFRMDGIKVNDHTASLFLDLLPLQMHKNIY